MCEFDSTGDTLKHSQYAGARFGDDLFTDLTLDSFNKLFVQLDVNKLKQQLEEILLDYNIAIAESDFADGRLHKKISKKAVNSVLALIGLEENE